MDGELHGGTCGERCVFVPLCRLSHLAVLDFQAVKAVMEGRQFELGSVIVIPQCLYYLFVRHMLEVCLVRMSCFYILV